VSKSYDYEIVETALLECLQFCDLEVATLVMFIEVVDCDGFNIMFYLPMSYDFNDDGVLWAMFLDAFNFVMPFDLNVSLVYG